MISYRKTKNGRWAVYGPVAEFTQPTVTVTKRDGSVKKETVFEFGEPFLVNGEKMIYGYPERESQSSAAGYYSSSRGRYVSAAEDEDDQLYEDMGYGNNLS